MTIPQVVDGVTDADAAFMNQLVDAANQANAAFNGAGQITTAAITPALEGYEPLSFMPIVATRNYRRNLSRFASLAAAIADLPNAGADGGEIYVDGEFAWSGSQTLPANVRLIGRGRGSSVLTLDPSPTVPALILDGSSNALIADLSIVLPSGSSAGVDGHGIEVRGDCENVWIERVYTDRLVRGINIEGASGTVGGTVERLTIRDCQCDNSPSNYGISLDDVDGALIENCAGYGNWLDGLKLRAKARNVTILGGRYNNNGVSGAGDGIDVYAGGSKFSAIGVECSGNNGSGITIKQGTLQLAEAATYGYVQEIIVSGCRFFSNTGVGCYLTVNEPTTLTEAMVDLVSVNATTAADNGMDGFYLTGRNVTATGCVSKENSRNGYTVGKRALDTHLVGCIAVANGNPTGFGFDLQGTRGSLDGCLAIGKNSDTVAVDSDYTALTAKHTYGFALQSNAVGPWIISETCRSLYHSTASSSGIHVNMPSGVGLVHQSGDLTPNTSALYGSIGSTYRKTDASTASDVLWCKTSGAPNSTTGWTKVTP